MNNVELMQMELFNRTKKEWKPIGDGQEAFVFSSPCFELYHLGDVIKLDSEINIACRVTNWNFDKKLESFQDSYRTFFKNILINIIEDNLGEHSVKHIPKPLGLLFTDHISAHNYLFVDGAEGWPAQYYDEEQSNWYSTKFKEWKEFSELFNSFGLSVQSDIGDPNSASVGKNIIYKYTTPVDGIYDGVLSENWKRIDFGTVSCPLNTDKLYLRSQDSSLSEKLGKDYDMFKLCVDYLQRLDLPSNKLMKKGTEYIYGLL